MFQARRYSGIRKGAKMSDRKSGDFSQRGINIAIGIASLTAALNILWLIFYLFDFYRLLGFTQTPGTTISINHTFHSRLIRIALALVIAAIALWYRRFIGLFLSAISLMWLGIEYISWYSVSLKSLRNAGLEHFPAGSPHAFNLSGATGWNAAILVIALALLAWEIKILFNAFILHDRRTRRQA
jgi:hypothetical protein